MAAARNGSVTGLRMPKSESLSRIDPDLLIGAKSVSHLKVISAEKTAQKGEESWIGVRADLVNIAELDSELEKVQSLNREPRGPSKGAAEPEPWEIDVAKLVMKEVIGRGTFGTVHRGTYNGRDVAVKLLHWGEDSTAVRAQLSAVRAAFKQEVTVWSQLDHPNVTQFIGASLGDDDGFLIPSLVAGNKGEIMVGGNICCVVVEYMSGGTLKDFLIAHHKKKLPLKTVIRLALDISRGLEYLHSKRVVHRDTKTENMLMTKKGAVKISDFGVARTEAADPKDMTGRTGTLGYMAPEVLDGRPYNHKADVYSFGICLWEIYVCDMPFPNLNLKEMASVVNQGMRPVIPGICPKPLAEIMRRCWDGQPANRPSMGEVTASLEAVDIRKGSGMVPIDNIPVHGGCFCF